MKIDKKSLNKVVLNKLGCSRELTKAAMKLKGNNKKSNEYTIEIEHLDERSRCALDSGKRIQVIGFII